MRMSRLDLLHTRAQGAFERLAASLTDNYTSKRTRTLFRPFETYRTPMRQFELWKKGTSRAMPWQSAHQYGLAVDFVPWLRIDGARWEDGSPVVDEDGLDAGAWSWDETHDWQHLEAEAARHGFDHDISWDKPHITHPLWHQIKIYMK